MQFANGAALGFFARENWGRAIELAETALLRRPNSLTSHVILAGSLHAKQDPGKAASAYFALEELYPGINENWLEQFIAVQDSSLKERILQQLRALGLPKS